MKYITYVGIVVLMSFMVACGPSKEELATASLAEAKQMFNETDTIGAVGLLDSLIRTTNDLPQLKARAVKTRKGYLREMVMRRKKSITYAEAEVETRSTNFVKQKEEFDRYASYIPKRQTLKRSWDRSFIEVHLNEKGELYLSSNYVGEEWLDHTGLRVYDSGDQAKTEAVPLDDSNNHHSDFMSMRWEKVNYKKGKSDQVISFISNNVDRNLKAVFLGKRYHYILLESYDKEAVRDALALSEALKEKARLELELSSMRKRMNKFN